MNAEGHERLREEFKRIFTRRDLTGAEILDVVLDVFLASDTHVDAVEVSRRLGRRGIQADEESVRRLLDVFRAYGIAERHDFEGVGERWEHHHIGMHHDHLVCVKCGGIKEFESHDIEALQEAEAVKHGFRMAHHRLVIYGVCPDCSRAGLQGFPLAKASVGERLSIVDFRGSGKTGARLASLGLHAGAEVMVMTNEGGGPIILARGDSRIGVDRDLARRLMVAPIGMSRRASRRSGPRGD